MYTTKVVIHKGPVKLGQCSSPGLSFLNSELNGLFKIGSVKGFLKPLTNLVCHVN